MQSRDKFGIVGVLSTCAAVFFVSAMPGAHAASLTNQDKASYKIEVIVKADRTQHELAPGKSLVEFCKEGCVIRLNGSAENDYALEGTERVSIEGGLVYYDGEEPQSKDKSPDGSPDRSDPGANPGDTNSNPSK